jgi:hypothetical protein
MQIGKNNNPNALSARNKALSRIKLERQARLLPHPLTFLLLALGLFVLNYWILSLNLLRSIIESVAIVAVISALEFGIYAYKNRRH